MSNSRIRRRRLRRARRAYVPPSPKTLEILLSAIRTIRERGSSPHDVADYAPEDCARALRGAP